MPSDPDDAGRSTPAGTPEPPSERPILAFFDVDNTLMRGTSLFQVGREALRRGLIKPRQLAPFAWHQLQFIRKGENLKHMADAKDRALGLAAGITQAQIEDLAEGIWTDRIRGRLYPETVALAREHFEKGHEVWLVSATPVEVASLMARRLGLTGGLGTVIEAVDGVYTGALEGHVLHGEHKAEAARALAEKAGADLADCWAYSDSRNDLPLLELVGNRVVVNPDAMLSLHAHQHGWPALRLTPKSIKAAAKRVRRDARSVEKEKRRTIRSDAS